MEFLTRVSTGLTGLDRIIDSLRIGDNVVWQVDSICDYRRFVMPFVQKALREQRKIVYMRFAQHEPLLQQENGIKVYHLDSFSGFESFSTQIHHIVSNEGEGVFYIFDCLSDLLSAWATDLMLGNFFVVTCPYLFELKTIAYFSILRNSHSFQTVARIRETTQLLLDVYRHNQKFYIHPLKVWNRYSPTMFLPHIEEKESFLPITSSVDATRLFACMPKRGLEHSERNLDYWDRLFLEASNVLQNARKKDQHALKRQSEMVEQLCKIVIGRDERILSLAKRNFSLEDLLEIKSRLIGSGFIGGKAVGMLLARNILLRDTQNDWQRYLEPHDSFYIGSDVFYTYLVQNGWWKLRMEQKKEEGYFKAASELKEKMLKGIFPDEIKEQFQQMLEYFGQSPIIVRSSSLLEDGFGNAFAGKYESIFCVNQGTPAERYRQFEEAVRKVFASTMNEDALTYRLQRGLQHRDEQMALLVQRVSGAYHKNYFFPYLAGVANSYNSYVWKSNMNPEAGMIRLVFGLGTRAVDRVEGDYPRIIALDAPLVQPNAGLEDVRKFSQHEVDVLDIRQNQPRTIALKQLMSEVQDVDMNLIAVPDHDINRRMKELGIKGQEAWILTYEKLLSGTNFVELMQKLLKTLEKNYQYPVDVEFTANPGENNLLHVNLLQCRPLQTKGYQVQIEMPDNVDKERILFQTDGGFMGGSITQTIKYIIFVDPEKYSPLPVNKKYELARMIGRLNRQMADRQGNYTLLLGPGRWGTSTPSLGVPVTFSEISNIAVLGELAFESAGLMPELSFGTHFFQDLVETDIFYVALFPEKENVMFNKDWFSSLPNCLTRFIPDSEQLEDIVKVYEVADKKVKVIADVVSQKGMCYAEKV